MATKKETAAPEAQQVRKMSVKNVGYTMKEVREHAEKFPNVPLVVFAGKTASTKMGESDYGPWCRFVGTFAARTHKGEIFTSHGLHLPADGEEMLVGAMASAGDGDEAQFTIEVYVRENNTAATGYEYACRPVGKVSFTDAAIALLGESDHAKDALLLLESGDNA